MKTLLSNSLRIISFVLFLGILNIISGCKSYFNVRASTGPVDKVIKEYRDQGKIFILHNENKAWIFESPSVSEQKLTGIAEREHNSVYKKPIDPNSPNPYKVNKHSVLLNEVHIYADSTAKISGSKVSIPLSAIRKIEYYRKDLAAAANYDILGGMALEFGTFLVLGVITIPLSVRDK